MTVGCSLSSKLAHPSSSGLVPACWLRWSTHLVLMLGLRPSGLVSPEASTLLQLRIYGCPLTLSKWPSSQFCSRASCDICKVTWSDSSEDRSGSWKDRYLDFSCLGKVRLPPNTSKHKQPFSLPSTIAYSVAVFPGLCLTLLPPEPDFLFWLQWKEREL